MVNQYDERTEEELREVAVEALLDLHPSARPDDDSALVAALMDAHSGAQTNQEQSLYNLNQSSFLLSASGEALTRIASNRFGIKRKEAQKATGVLKFSRDTPPSSPLTIDKGTIAETVSSDPIQFETTEEVTMGTSSTTVSADAQAVEGGTNGNVGSNTIESLPSPPSNSLSVTNPNAFGDPSTTLTDGSTKAQQGLNKESDSELRNRSLDATAFGGAATEGAIKTALGNIEGVISVSGNTNPTSTDNSGTGGLPPYSSEYIIYGGQTSDLVIRLSELMTLIDFQRLTGGVSGTKETYDVYSETLDQMITGEITRPTKVDVDMDLTLVVTDSYAGDDTVKSTIVQYIGGFDTDNSRVTGLGIGDDVIISELEAEISTVPGVRGISNAVYDYDADGDLDGTDDTTTDADGLQVLSISDTEVALTDGTDTSITITQTQV